MAAHMPLKPWKIAYGEDGSGGQITLENILKYSKLWTKYANSFAKVPNVSFDDSVRKMESKEIDAYFVMDSRSSEKIQKILDIKDEKGNSKYKLVSLDLNNSFFGNDGPKNWLTGKPLYSKVDFIEGGWFSSGIQAISVSAVLYMRKDFIQSKPGGIDGTTIPRVLHSAINNSSPQIRSDFKVPEEWEAAN